MSIEESGLKDIIERSRAMLNMLKTGEIQRGEVGESLYEVLKDVSNLVEALTRANARESVLVNGLRAVINPLEHFEQLFERAGTSLPKEGHIYELAKDLNFVQDLASNALEIHQSFLTLPIPPPKSCFDLLNKNKEVKKSGSKISEPLG